MSEVRLTPPELIEAHQRSLDEQQAIPDEMPLMELAEAVVRGKIKLGAQQQRMLIELLPFLAPKLSAMAVGSMNGKDFASALERAIQRSLAGKPIKLIEAQAIEVEEEGR